MLYLSDNGIWSKKTLYVESNLSLFDWHYCFQSNKNEKTLTRIIKSIEWFRLYHQHVFLNHSQIDNTLKNAKEADHLAFHVNSTCNLKSQYCENKNKITRYNNYVIWHEKPNMLLHDANWTLYNLLKKIVDLKYYWPRHAAISNGDNASD